MSPRIAGLAVAGLLIVAPAAFATNITATVNPREHDLPGSFADLVEKLVPAVVNVSTTQTVTEKSAGDDGDQPQLQLPPGSPFEDFFKDFMERHGSPVPRKVTSLGSGFVVDPKGLIVTNNHVIADADEIKVTFTDGTTLNASVAGRDTKTDLAVLRVKTTKDLPYVQFGDSDVARVGDWVLAIGNPFGLGGTVTSGIISARSRDINAGPYDDFLQTDAAINRGNSGGPLFDTSGRVIGVNTAIISPSGGSIGNGFALPANNASPVVSQLLKFGETRRGWLGVRVQTVTPEIAESLGLGKPHGALVAGVTGGGPAAKAGVETGDVIVAFDDKPIAEMRDLPRRVADTPVGDPASVKVWRKGQTKTFRLTLGRLEESEDKTAAGAPAPEPAKTVVGELGLSLATVTAALRDRYNIAADVNGVLVVDVARNGPAATVGVAPGDVIVKVGVAQTNVASPKDVVAGVEAERKTKKSVLLLLNRGGDIRYVAVRLGESGKTGAGTDTGTGTDGEAPPDPADGAAP
jgi:serine protease Do